MEDCQLDLIEDSAVLNRLRVAVVIPAFRVRGHVLEVIAHIGPEVERIFVIDDCCPEGSGRMVEEAAVDARVRVLYHQSNKGVGGATITGYLAALAEGFDIIVKVDGDGQMNPRLIPHLIRPILMGAADYTKGNRFYNLESLREMPLARLFGNSILSFVSKVASGYWNVMDPTNGFTAIHAVALGMLPHAKLDRRYFFESDMLFRLNTIRAVVKELPMDASYGCEKSNLVIARVALDFPGKYCQRFFKRLVYNYYLRDFNACSVQILWAIILLTFGFSYGMWHWFLGYAAARPNPIGTVMVATLPVILGFQSLLSAVQFDVVNVPKEPLQSYFTKKK